MDHKINKLENPKRLEELCPKDTLLKIGLKDNMVFCDIGAGSGIFTFTAAELTANSVYAVEISEEMCQVLRSRSRLPNIEILKSIQDVPADSCDIALLCAVLHELDDVPLMLGEIRRILKRDALLAVIEFHKERTPLGPPPEHRISEPESEKIMAENGFALSARFQLGENFYCMLFKPIREA